MSSLDAPKGAALTLTANETTSTSVLVPCSEKWPELAVLSANATIRYRFGDADDDATQSDMWLYSGDQTRLTVTGDYFHAIVATGGGTDKAVWLCPVRVQG